MNTRKLFLTSLLAAAAMSIPAWADEITSAGRTISTDTSVEQIYFSQNGTLTVDAGAALTITGAEAKAEADGAAAGDRSSFSFGNANRATINVNGTLNLLEASGFGTVWGTMGMIVGNGGVANLKALTVSAHYNNNNSSTVTLETGGTLNLGTGGYKKQYVGAGFATSVINLTLNGGTLGALDSWSTSDALTASGNVTINTTKYDATNKAYLSGDGAGATISANGGLAGTGKFIISGLGNVAATNVSVASLEIASGASMTISGALSSASVTNSGTLDLSGARVSLANTIANTIANSGIVTVSDATVFNLTQTGETTLISGSGTITGSDLLRASNFTYYGAAIDTMRSTWNASSSSVAVTLSVANLTWAGTSENSTWNVKMARNWTNASTSASDVFYNGDNVTFDASTTGTTAIAADVTVTNLTISGGTHTFTRSNDGYVVVAGTATVQNGATLDLGTETGGTGLLRGAITVKDGGTLRFSAKDVTGYDGGANSLSTINVNSGGVLELAHSENETFAGTLNLNGTLKAAESLSVTPRFDFFGNATLNVGEKTTAKITGVNIGLRRDDVIFTVGNNSTLTIDGVISNSWPNASSGNGTLTKEGKGKLVLTKAEGAATAPVSTIVRFVNNGTTRVEGGATLNITGTGTNDNGSLNWGTFVVGAGSTVNVTTDFKASAWSDSKNGVKTLNVEDGATLNVGGSMRNAAGLTLNNGGLITAGTIDYSSGGNWSTNTFSGNGYIVADTFNVGNTARVVFENQTFVVGGFSWSWYGGTPQEVRFGNATFGAKQDWSTNNAFTLTGKAGTEATTTVFNTGVFDAESKTFSETTGHTITLGGVLSGKGGIKKAGAGTLKLSGNNTFEGGVKLEAGTLELGHNKALGSAALTIQSGTLAPELKLGTDASGNALTISNNLSVLGLGTVTVSSAHDGNELSGSISASGQEIRKVGSGTLTLSGTNTGESVFIVNVAEGKIIAKTDTALGAGMGAGVADYHKVRLSGGQLEVGSGVTLAQTNIEIVLSDAYSSTAAITGDGALATGTTITIADIQAAAIAAESALGNDSWTFQIATADSTIAASLAKENFVLAETLQGTWQISDYTDGVLTIAAIPEPSTFGLLAGLGALALAGTRRRRKKA